MARGDGGATWTFIAKPPLSLVPLRGGRDGRPHVALEDLSPPPAHLALEPLGRLAEALEVAVLEVDARPLGPEERERHLDLGHERRVVLEAGVQLPREQDA